MKGWGKSFLWFVATFVTIVILSESYWWRWWHTILVVGAFLLLRGFVQNFIYERRYADQTERRRKIIGKLCEEGDDWEHMALVLKHSGFKSEQGMDIKVDQIKAEHAAIVLLDHDLESGLIEGK